MCMIMIIMMSSSSGNCGRSSHFSQDGIGGTLRGLFTVTPVTLPAFLSAVRVPQVFLPEYGPLLGRRAATFQFIFEWLEGLSSFSRRRG